MRRFFLCTIGLALLTLFGSPAAFAQDDAPTCERVVQAAAQTAAESCAGLMRGDACYGNGFATAVSRFLSTDLTFDAAGDIVALSEVESVETLPAGDDVYSVVLLDIGQGGETESVQAVLFGAALVTNNVVPQFELTLTTNAVSSVQAEPTGMSETVLALIPGDTVTATGRNGEGEDTWVKVSAEGVSGWIRAGLLEEADMLSNLPEVDDNAPIFAPMQQLSVTSEREDRLCESVPDSGLLLQMPDAETMLGINGLALTLEPESRLYVQGRANTTVDLYIVEGNAAVGDVTVEAGSVLSAPVGLDGQADMERLPEAATYDENKVAPLALLAAALPSSAEEQPVEMAAQPTSATDATTTEEAPNDDASTGSGLDTIFGTLFGGDADATEDLEPAQAEEIPGGVAGAEPTEELEPVQAEEIPGGVAGAEPTAEIVAEAAAETLTASSPLAQTVRERGTLRVGVNGSLPSFSNQVDGNFVGFEPDLARAVAEVLFADEVQIEFVTVSARQRSTVLQDGSIDLMMRNTAFTPDREDWGLWTNTFYFVDGQRLMVSADSGLTGFGDLAGGSVGVQSGTDAEASLSALAADNEITVVPVPGTLFELLGALDDGTVDAISADWTALEAIRLASETPDAYQVVGQLLTDITWNATVPSGAEAFRAEVDAAILRVVETGNWQQIYEANFPDTPLPSSLELVFAPGAIAIAAAPADVPADTSAEEANIEDTAPTPVQAQEVQPTATPMPTATPAPPTAEAPAPTTIPVEPENLNAPPVTGEVTVNIFTVLGQQRTVVITPLGDTFLLELVRNGEIVYSGTYAFYEESGRYENVRNSFEYVEFSDTAGDTSLGCERAPDIRGFFNGAEFEGRVDC